MVTTLDTKLVPKAAELVELYGKSVTWGVTSGGSYNPASGDVTGSSTTSYTVKVTPPEPYSERWIDGDLVRVGDAKVYLAAQDLAFTPSAGQTVTIDATVWKAVSANAIYTGESIALWEVQVRR